MTRMSKLTTRQARVRRHKRVRKQVFGTAERPRLVVFRSNRGIAAQLVDDAAGRTVAAASSLERSERDGKQVGPGGRGGQAARREREGG